ncbi:WD40 domain-containing protein [Cephalotus follicularis]|uniref:WD40 domain-containing protein n=1 Tax=Cephalotus follicularis TaxID=3775 RepID=A0A1Q3CLZ0_CEPFO|nr:WD40 domain-containing protein [Cephalotus follicularis]
MKHITTEFHPQSQSQSQLTQEQERERQKEKENIIGQQQDEHEEDRARCEWDFNLSTLVSSSTTGAVSDALGVIEFDPSDSVMATGGIARKIRIYSTKCLLPQESNTSPGEHDTSATVLLDHASACDHYICTPAKLSSLRWRPGSDGRVLGSGDYDGVVMEYDLERRISIFERDEHGGRRVWSMDYSHRDPVLGASGSDDGTMQMWDPRCTDGGKCVAAVYPSASHSPVCCVEFNQFGGALIAVGCADRRAYGYDIRKMVDPVVVFDGHKNTVTYIRFLDAHTIVSAGTDGCLMLWNVDDLHVIRTYKGHVNNRSFVGLSVWRHGGLLGCGSENNQVFVYDKRWGQPIWVHGIEPVDTAGFDHDFVSGVCWRQTVEDQCTLVAGGSNGDLQVFVGKRKCSSISMTFLPCTYTMD